jgi:formylglycine-generating enzyme required for sulfatase activity
MCTEADETILADLLLRWEELREQGRDADAGALCADAGRPGLAEELERRISDLRDVDVVLNRPGGGVDSGPERAAPGSTVAADGRGAGGGDEQPEVDFASSQSHYRELRYYRRGGLGEIFKAHQDELGRGVALKFIQSRHVTSPYHVSRFLREAGVTGRLQHPGIVPIYGTGRGNDGRPCYAMRFIEGESLEAAIDRFHRPGASAAGPDRRYAELSELLDRLISVCETMAYAHSRGVLHRDLKPANIMLGPYGETIVVDWGLAKSFQDDEAKDGVGDSRMNPDTPERDAYVSTMGPVGTPEYMSPEQAEGPGGVVGPASDVYSLGVILYKILTGCVPVRGRDPIVTLNMARRGDFLPPRRLKATVPRALEAVCLKVLARDPSGRYATAKNLAEDLKRWRNGQPVSAWREPIWVRAQRWVKRYRTPVIAAVTAALVATLGLVAYVAQRLANAQRRVDALATAEIRAVPEIIRELGADRRLVRGRLEAIARAGVDDRRRIPAALALLPDDPRQADFLAGRLSSPAATPEEVLVIRDVLIDRGLTARVAPRLREVLQRKAQELTDEQLHAAGALVRLAPDDPLLAAATSSIARKLVRENPLRIAAWREVFQPIAVTLTGPLRKIYADHATREPRALAFALLFEFATRPDNPTESEDLVALVSDADPDQFRQVLSRLETTANWERAGALLTPKVAVPARFDDDLARRQGRMAMALLRLGRAEVVWPLFRQRDDPSLRTELIHNLSPFESDPSLVVERLRVETDVSAQRALILCLGEFPDASIPAATRGALATELLARYREDPDPGVHGGIDWLLRQRWGLGKDLDRIDREVASPALPKGRDWYVNGQGQTYTIVRGPVEFLMGSTKQRDPEREPDEVQHARRIGHSFAIATKEVTVAEYARFLESKPAEIMNRRDDEEFKKYIPSIDCAIGAVTWYEAAAYCNWLSALEKIPESQRCYPKRIGPGMRLPADYLSRTGYRLPTEAEWEYACRAGAVSSRPYGGATAWLGAYGWFQQHSGLKMHPVGRLKPNDLGLFDVLGNAHEWCSDQFRAYGSGTDGRAVDDALVGPEVSADVLRILRGGCFFNTGPYIRSALRYWLKPSEQDTMYGLRPVRTLN